MRYLRYASLSLLLFAGCAQNPYRGLKPIAGTPVGITRLIGKPAFSRELYRCVVDGKFLLKRFHLSGVLLFKAFDDGSQRAVFQNELGISFFNFKWDAQDSFSVTSIMPQLDKPAVVRTLRTDFELLLRKNLDTGSKRVLQGRDGAVVELGKNAGHAWYGREAPQIAYGGSSLVTSIVTDSAASADGLPSSIRIRHHKARFTIDLTRIPPDDN